MVFFFFPVSFFQRLAHSSRSFPATRGRLSLPCSPRRHLPSASTVAFVPIATGVGLLSSPPPSSGLADPDSTPLLFLNPEAGHGVLPILPLQHPAALPWLQPQHKPNPFAVDALQNIKIRHPSPPTAASSATVAPPVTSLASQTFFNPVL
ncbi:uncharacterized protein [Elaeis guineensis]|uniref:uncharacterized protein n=1 Tax=Elaeis guineensis var. tenera TaxID=51953 RepID=UPI003C6DADBD